MPLCSVTNLSKMKENIGTELELGSPLLPLLTETIFSPSTVTLPSFPPNGNLAHCIVAAERQSGIIVHSGVKPHNMFTMWQLCLP